MDCSNRPLRVKVTEGASIGTCAVTCKLCGTSDCVPVDGAMAGRVFLLFVEGLRIAALCAIEPSINIGNLESVSDLLAKD